MSTVPEPHDHPNFDDEVREHMEDIVLHDVDRRGVAYALKGVLALSSFRQAIGAQRLPGSLENGPDIFGQTAATALCLGCIISIVGIAWQGRRGSRHRLDGLVIEQFGLVGVFVGCSLYVTALFLAARPVDAAFASGLSFGLAVAAAWQYRVLSKYRDRMLAHLRRAD